MGLGGHPASRRASSTGRFWTRSVRLPSWLVRAQGEASTAVVRVPVTDVLAGAVAIGAFLLWALAIHLVGG